MQKEHHAKSTLIKTTHSIRYKTLLFKILYVNLCILCESMCQKTLSSSFLVLHYFPMLSSKSTRLTSERPSVISSAYSSSSPMEMPRASVVTEMSNGLSFLKI